MITKMDDVWVVEAWDERECSSLEIVQELRILFCEDDEDRNPDHVYFATTARPPSGWRKPLHP